VLPVRGGASDYLAAALDMPLPARPGPSLDHLEWDRLGRETFAAYDLARRRRGWWRRLRP
jgi:hypothetical protein